MIDIRSVLQIPMSKLERRYINDGFSCPRLLSSSIIIIHKSCLFSSSSILTMAPSNRALFLTAKNAPLELRPAPYTPPGQNEMIVKNVALAINPYDYLIQEAPGLVVAWAKLPIILGTDAAGEITEVGKGVTQFKVGDRVVAHAIALEKSVNRSCEGGFQEYTVIRDNMTSPIPQFMSYETACVLPLALSTAACALFMEDSLALPFPTINPTASGKTLLVWGGSTSVGCNAIQLAKAAGYQVITTGSPKNHAYLKTLGAAEVFDYRSTTDVTDITRSFKDRSTAGAIAIGNGAFDKCLDILSGCQGNKFIACCTMDLPPFPKGALGFPPFLLAFITKTMSMNFRSRKNDVGYKMVNGSVLVGNKVSKAIYEEFLPKALERKTFVPAPEPQVVGKGFESVQEAMNMSKKGVSAKKLVVTL